MKSADSVSGSSSRRQLRSNSATPSKAAAAKETKTTAISPPRVKTGLVYDERMMANRNIWLADHAERPERIKVCYERAKELGLVEKCVEITPRFATDAEIAECHTADLMKDVVSSEKASEEELLKLSRKHSTHFSNDSYQCALLSAGSCLNLLDAVMAGECHNGMAIVRPPGHHASPDKANGYCYFNNAAIVAHNAIKKYGLSRILIVDWDVHHGQGTQRFFYNNSEVLYISIHRYEYAQFWPNLRESDWDFIGAGEGLGYNINIPLNKTGMGDSDYIAIFQQIILPIAREYEPELVIVSAGYDAAIGCPEGEMLVTPACYAHLVHSLRQFASGKVCVLLEGGYCLKSLAEAAALTLRDLLGEPCPLLSAGAVKPCHPTVARVILMLMRTLRPYWNNAFLYQGEPGQDDGRWKAWAVQYSKQRKMATYVDEYRDEYWTPHENTGGETPERHERMSKLIDQVLFVPRPLANYTKLTICISDGDAMLLHKAPSGDRHPECPERIISIVDRLKKSKVLCDEQKGVVNVIKSRPATKQELLLAHSERHVEEIFSLPNQTSGQIKQWAQKQNSIYANQDSLTSALHSAGGVIDSIEEVLSGRSAAAFAAVRPPGHHSDSCSSAGFCIFNSVAVAIEVAKAKHGLKRILVLDWDVHFGDGTSDIFYDDPSVLYISLHCFENGTFYPGKAKGDYYNVGSGAGIGYNVNIPWSGGAMGSSEYLTAFERIVMPIAYEYDPELIVISAGFDACIGDPLGGYEVTPDAYAAMTLYLTQLAGGRCVVALEGGYNLNSISMASESCCKALLGITAQQSRPLTKPKQKAINVMNQILEVQSEYWKCLVPFRVSLPSEDSAKLRPSSESTQAKGMKTPSPNAKSMETTPMPPPPPFQTPVVPQLTNSGLDGLAEAFKKISVQSDPKPVPHSVALALGMVESNDQITMTIEENDETGFLVDVLETCPHVEDSNSISCKTLDNVPESVKNSLELTCHICDDGSESWVCLSCFQVGCGRYHLQHALGHYMKSEQRHPLAFGCADLSLWCYSCEQYINPKKAGPVYLTRYRQRFGEDPPDML